MRNFDNQEDYNISFKPINERKNVFNGFPGAPVLVNGYIVGILTEQSKDNCKAIRIFGICGLEFRNMLAEFGVKVNINKPNIGKQQVFSNSIVEIPALSIVNFQEIDDVLNQLFKQIELKRYNGKKLQSQKELKDFLFQLKDVHCSEEKKQNFIILAQFGCC